MAQLIFSSKTENGEWREQRFLLQKRIATIGTEVTHDAVVNASIKGVVFTLVRENDEFDILPGQVKMRINGQAVYKKTKLKNYDRIEWDKGVGVFLSTSIPVADPNGPEQSKRSWNMLQNLAATLQSAGSIDAALYQALDGLIDMAGAETGYLLTETGDKSEWELLAFREAQGGTLHPLQTNRKQLFSNSILQQALQKREPIYIESIIGHALADAASVMAAKIFSAACFPLIVGDRVFGAVFLSTQSPGKSIRRETLTEISLVATQAALMLALQKDLKVVRNENNQLRSRLDEPSSLMIYNREPGASPEMAELDGSLRKLAATPLSIVIRGETGCGKEVVAREIHGRSERAEENFIAVNCGAIPAALLESVLFGHEKGAFTGAINAQVGKFAQANKGTLLLDEIGDLPIDLQVKLLRILQEKKVEPLGSREAISIDVRILAATHVDLEAAVKAGKFRQDLYFRLVGATVRIPALRERRADIPYLVQHFLKKIGSTLAVSKAAMDVLMKHNWPGNVRELEQVITRASYLCEGTEITPSDIDVGAIGDTAAPERELFWNGFASIPNLKDAQLAFTREFVQRTLEQNGGNRTEAAYRLGISERTLYRVISEAETL